MSTPGRVGDQGDQGGGPGWTGFRIPDSDVVFFFFHENQPVSRRSSFTALGFLLLRLMDRKNRHETLENNTKDSNLSWRPCCCLRFSKQATAPSFTDTSTRAVASTFKSCTSARAVTCTVKKKQNSLHQQCHSLTDRGSGRGEATICSWICGTGTAKNCTWQSTPPTFNSFGSLLQATSPFPPSNRNEIACS